VTGTLTGFQVGNSGVWILYDSARHALFEGPVSPDTHLPHGEGLVHLGAGCTYKGEISQGRPEGNGRLEVRDDNDLISAHHVTVSNGNLVGDHSEIPADPKALLVKMLLPS